MMLVYTAFIMIFLCICLSIIANNAQFKKNDPVSNKAWLQTTAACYYVSAFLMLMVWGYYSLKTTYSLDSFTMTKKLSSMNVFLRPLPAAFTGLLLIFAASQLLLYQTRLIEKRVVGDYFEWKRTFTFLLIVQLILLVNAANNDFKYKPFNYLVYIICLLNFIILGIIHILLHFFSTDG
jgi:hypothetical protein